MQSPQTPANAPSSSEPRHGSNVGAIPGAIRNPRALMLARAGVLEHFAAQAAQAAKPAAIEPPPLPEDASPSQALRAVKASGHPHAHYLPHIGKRQIARAQRQAERVSKGAQAGAAIGAALSGEVGVS